MTAGAVSDAPNLIRRAESFLLLAAATLAYAFKHTHLGTLFATKGQSRGG